MKTSFVRAAFAVALLSGSALGISMLLAEQAQAADHLSSSVQKPLAEATKLMNAGDFQGALAKVREAQAAGSTKDFDIYKINQFLAAIDIKLNDYAGAATAEEAAADSSAMPDEDKKDILHNALLLSGQQKQWQKTLSYGQQLQALNGMDQQTTGMMALAYYNTSDSAHAKQFAQQAIDMAKAAGQTPDTALTQILMNAQVAQNDQAGAQATLEQLYLQSGDASSLGQLVDASYGANGMNETYYLDMLRLKFLAGVMQPDDYTQLASTAYLVGLPVEAVNVLEKGNATGGKNADILRKSRNDAAMDQRQLAGNAADAAKAKSGQLDVKMAEDYWGFGRFADAEASARRAISKGGIKVAGEGQLMLGMALVAQGKYDEAIQVLGQVTGNAAAQKTAHLWSLYAQAKKGPATSQSLTSAPAPTH
ncbi:MAG: hypothetical protein ABSD74_16005 [Rhizomicrobium sp.]|jgi:hypothetical protein